MDRVVLVLASGASWESEALQRIDERPGLVVLKRCVDVDDLLASAASGQAEVAVVGDRAGGLDARVVEQLWEYGVRPVLVASADGPVRASAGRLGLASVVQADRLEGLPDLLLAAEHDVPAPRAPAVPAEPAPAQPRGKDRRVIAVWGGAGAPGRTTVATGLASALAAAGEPVTIVDADPYGGAVGQTLGLLDEASGMLTAARLATTGALADGRGSWVRGLGDRLGVVTGLPRADRWPEVRPGTIEAMVDELRPRGHVVLDTGFCLEEDPALDFGPRPGRNHMTLAGLAAADAVLVVGSADPVGLARLARAAVELREQAMQATPYVVVNRMRPTLGWSEQEVTRTLSPYAGPSGLCFLPEDRVAVDRSLVAGRSVVEAAPESPLARALAGLAAALVPTAAPPQRTGGLARLRRRRTA